MANTVTGPSIQFQGDRKLINTCFVACDGGNASSVTLVDVSALSTASNEGRRLPITASPSGIPFLLSLF